MIKFIFKWIIPIGIVQIIVNNIKLLSTDNVGNIVFFRLGDVKKKNMNGANILIRKKNNIH